MTRVAKTTVPSGGRGSGGEDVGCGNMGEGRWGGEATDIEVTGAVASSDHNTSSKITYGEPLGI
jgi:hypothetical protein